MMEASTPDQYDDNSDDDQAEQWEHDVKHETPAHTSPSAGGNGNGGGQSHSKPHIPMQKRRRVTRACDECRRKKMFANPPHLDVSFGLGTGLTRVTQKMRRQAAMYTLHCVQLRYAGLARRQHPYPSIFTNMYRVYL